MYFNVIFLWSKNLIDATSVIMHFVLQQIHKIWNNVYCRKWQFVAFTVFSSTHAIICTGTKLDYAFFFDSWRTSINNKWVVQVQSVSKAKWPKFLAIKYLPSVFINNMEKFTIAERCCLGYNFSLSYQNRFWRYIMTF